MLKRKAILFYFVPPQQPSTRKKRARLPLETKHMVDGNDVTPSKIIFRGDQTGVYEYIVQNLDFNCIERVLYWTQWYSITLQDIVSLHLVPFTTYFCLPCFSWHEPSFAQSPSTLDPDINGEVFTRRKIKRRRVVWADSSIALLIIT